MTPLAPTQTTNLTRISDLTPERLARLLELAEVMKDPATRGDDVLRDRTIALIFEQPSTRTRVAFAAAIGRLGATRIPLMPHELQLGHGESVAELARSLSGYVDAIVIHAFTQATADELARWATVPVVNALSNEHHPCQALADLLTIKDEFGDLEGRHLTFVGDGGDNIAHSLLEAGALAGVDVTIACPEAYGPGQAVLARAHRLAEHSGAKLLVLHDPRAAVAGAHAVYANVWASRGEELQREESERETRGRALAPYQVTDELMSLAQPGAIFLHCLPATRGHEVAASVIDGPQSAIWRQSANLLPTEEAVLMLLARGGEV
jgi:ornithine carbamoyltransferase